LRRRKGDIKWELEGIVDGEDDNQELPIDPLVIKMTNNPFI